MEYRTPVRPDLNWYLGCNSRLNTGKSAKKTVAIIEIVAFLRPIQSESGTRAIINAGAYKEPPLQNEHKDLLTKVAQIYYIFVTPNCLPRYYLITIII